MKKNPVACAAGLATLEILIDQRLPERARQKGEFAVQKLQEELNDVPTVSEIRGLGLLIGIELESSSIDSNTLAEKIMYECLNAGLSFKVSMGNVLTLAPPLNIEQQDLERALEILILAVRKHSG